jgi:hypothetical protein
MKINKGNKKILVCSRDENALTQERISNQILEEVQKFVLEVKSPEMEGEEINS